MDNIVKMLWGDKIIPHKIFNAKPYNKIQIHLVKVKKNYNYARNVIFLKFK